ncbi:MAG: DUF1799 domain-containing protein [Bdellovibrionales bacterium]
MRGAPKDERSDDLSVFGAPQEVLDATKKEIKAFEVYEDNWTTVELFQALSTQWVWSSGGGAVGLNYQSIDFLFKLLKIKERVTVFSNLRIMEIAAIQEFEKKNA